MQYKPILNGTNTRKTGPKSREVLKLEAPHAYIYGQAVTKVGRKHCIPEFNTKLKQHKTKFIFENSCAQE